MKIIDFIIYIRPQDLYPEKKFRLPQMLSQARVVGWGDHPSILIRDDLSVVAGLAPAIGIGNAGRFLKAQPYALVVVLSYSLHLLILF